MLLCRRLHFSCIGGAWGMDISHVLPFYLLWCWYHTTHTTFSPHWQVFSFRIKIISAGKQTNPSVTLRVPAPLSGEPFCMLHLKSLPWKGRGTACGGGVLPAFSFIFLIDGISAWADWRGLPPHLTSICSGGKFSQKGIAKVDFIWYTNIILIRWYLKNPMVIWRN